MDFDRSVCFSFYSTANAMIRFYSSQLKAFGTTYPQLLVMSALWDEDSVSIGQLSEKTLFDLGSLTPILKRMSENDFIQITEGIADKRVRIIKLTSKGRDFEKNAKNIFAAMEEQISLSEDEQEQIFTVSKRIKNNLLTNNSQR